MDAGLPGLPTDQTGELSAIDDDEHDDDDSTEVSDSPAPTETLPPHLALHDLLHVECLDEDVVASLQDLFIPGWCDDDTSMSAESTAITPFSLSDDGFDTCPGFVNPTAD